MNSEQIIFCCVAILCSGIGIGSLLFYNTNFEKGRTEAIKTCIEKPKVCRLEYDYLKYKETQK